jgi:hypothetical protein
MAKNSRNIPGNKIQDPSAIANLEYSDAAGSKKVSEVGRHLVPLKFISGGVVAYTTDASTARRLDFPGKCLAVYNNAGAIGSVTLGNVASAPSSLAPGVTDASGNVGVPCPANSWTYLACADNYWVIASAATLLVFLIDDETSIKQESVS